MRKLILFTGFFASLLFWQCAASKPPVAVGEQTAQTFQREIKMTVAGEYLLYLPQNYETSKDKWPLMLFLHGAGERGDDLEKVKVHGPPKLVANGKEFPFVLVSPQCPEGMWWSTDVLDALLNEITENYNIDENRIYVTGLSMGGFGTWALAEKYPHRFAAIAPVCGGGDPAAVPTFSHLPVWVFHGAKDNVVPIDRSEAMVNELKKNGADVQFTVYPEAGHDSWTETYDNPALYEWFLKQRRK